MGYSNGQVESEVKSGKGEKGDPGLPGIGFNLTDDGNFDLDGKRLTDVANPIDDGDPTTKRYVDQQNESNKSDVILRDGSQNMTGNLDLNNNKIVNLGSATDDHEAVNLSQLKDYTQSSQNNYHLQPSFRFYKDFGDRSESTKRSPPNIPSGHFFQNHLYHRDSLRIEKEGFDNGFGGQAWVSLKMTNDRLPQGTYTSIFEIFSIGEAGGFLTDDTLIFNVSGDSHYKMITFGHDKINNQYTKAYIQFTSDGQLDEITFQIRYYGVEFDNIRFLLYSRVIKGKENIDFNHNILNISDVDDNHEILYFENLNLNSNLINGLGDPVADADATNKKYVDDENAKQDIAINDKTSKSYVDNENAKQDIAIADKASKSYVDNEIAKIPLQSQNVLLLDGSKSMTGNCDMGNNKIVELENNPDYKEDDPLHIRHTDLHSAVNKGYLNSNFLKLNNDDNFDLKGKRIVNSEPNENLYGQHDIVTQKYVDQEIGKIPKPETDLLKLDGSKAMTGNLDMGNHTIIGIRSSSQDNAALTVGGAKSAYLDLVGAKAMRRNLDMGGFAINNLKPFVEDDTSQETRDAQKNDAINFGYFEGERAYLKEKIEKGLAEHLSLDGSGAMQGDLDMANHSIVNLKEPQSHQSTYAAKVNFVNNSINDNNTILDTLIDKFKFKIDYDSKIGYYSTRLSIDLVYLPVGYYTMIFELYPSNKIDLDEITVNAQSGTLSVSKINTKKSSSHTSGQGKFFPSHTRSVINFYKAVIYPSLDDLDIDIALKNKVGESYDADTQIFVAVYGVAGTQNDVESLVWDRFYYIDNQKVYFEAPLDMQNHDITNVNNLSFSNYFNMNNKNIKFLQDGVEDGDAVNIKQINEVESNVADYANREIQKVNTNVSNNSNMIERILKYLIRKETPFSLIRELYFPDSLEGTTQNYYTLMNHI